MKKTCLILLFLFTGTYPVLAENSTYKISGPDKSVQFSVNVKNGILYYSINRNGRPVIESSKLGLVINGKPQEKVDKIGLTTSYSLNEKYAWRGGHSVATNHFIGAKIDMLSASGQLVYTLDVRVFNDGASFRYIVPAKGQSVISKDLTQFVIPGRSVVWSQDNIKYYEGSYKKKKIEEVSADDKAGPPLTVELPAGKGYAAITEAGLTDFAGMALTVDGNNGYSAFLSGETKKSGSFETPWRVIMAVSNLNALVNNDMVANLSPKYNKALFPDGFATKWVKPGKSVWSWLANTNDVTLENMKHFSDLAAELGFEYNLVDEGWGKWKDGNCGPWEMMKELVDYSAKKGVKVWVWKAYPDRNGIPGIDEEKKRKAFFQKCKDIGIVGMKVDFFDSENQTVVNFYQDALHDAAQYQLMMDFHGSNKPTGESRTWPNEMSREGIRGLETAPPWAGKNTILPFTRYLAGHADFTPVNFGKRLGETTWAHQVASMAIFTSSFLCLGADPQEVLDNPCKKMIQNLPVTWDETRVLSPSKIGELAVFARRKGNTWFLAAMNSNGPAKTISVDLSFMGKGIYEADIIKDNSGKQNAVSLEKRTVKASDKMSIKLNMAGGYVARFAIGK